MGFFYENYNDNKLIKQGIYSYSSSLQEKTQKYRYFHKKNTQKEKYKKSLTKQQILVLERQELQPKQRT